MRNYIYTTVVLLTLVVFRAEAKMNISITEEIGKLCLKTLSSSFYIDDPEDINKIKETFYTISKAGDINSAEFSHENTLDIISSIFPEIDRATLDLDRRPISNIIMSQYATGGVGSANEYSFFEKESIGCDEYMPKDIQGLYLTLFQQKYNPLIFFLLPLEIKNLFLESTQIEIRKNMEGTLFLFAGINNELSYGYVFTIEIIADKVLHSFIIYRKQDSLMHLELDLEKLDLEK